MTAASKDFAVLVIALLMAIFPQSSLHELTAAEQNDAVRSMVLCYANDPQGSEDQVRGLLELLTRSNEDKGERWTRIMEYWRYANTELPVHLDRLPQGLDDSEELCIVVLGYQLNRDGTLKDELVGRLRTALTCAEQYPNAYLLCTGGGTASQAPQATEAGRMAEWLLERGVDPGRIITEERSKTTGQNAKFSCALLLSQYPQVKRVAIVSSSNHIAWGSVLFEAAFILAGEDAGSQPIQVVSNAAYKVTRRYPLTYQASGLLELLS